MKIISQSQSVSHPPYFHLAYVAATSPEPVTLFSGIALIAVGTVLLLRILPKKIKTESDKSEEDIKKEKSRNVYKCVMYFLAGVLLLVVSYHVLGDKGGRDRSIRILNMTKLGSIGTALYVFANDHENQFPPFDTWCDAIDNDQYIENIKTFHFNAKPDADTDISEDEKITSWIMNSNVSGDINKLPPDMVLLFKGPKGWNRSGGAGLLEVDEKGGCLVLFVDGHVEYVKADDLNKLKWTADVK